MKNVFENVEGIKKRTATVFFLIDQSGSMSGTKIGSVNHAMGETIPEMCKLVEDNADANLDIAVLLFSNGANWMTPKPVHIENFHWNNIDSLAVTDFGYALKELNEKLSRKDDGFMKDASESFAPAFILMSDGQPTDEYKKHLEALNHNGWFKHGTKTAIAIGNDADKNMLAEFTGSSEAVIEVHNAEDLAKVIKFVSITSSQIVTSASSATMASRLDPNAAPIITVPDDMLDNYDEF